MTELTAVTLRTALREALSEARRDEVCPCGTVECNGAPLVVTLVMRTPAERHAFTEAKQNGAFTSDVALLKVATWKLLRHLGAAMPEDAFALPYTVPVVAEELALEQEQLSLLEQEGEGE